MANAIALAKKYVPLLDEVYKRASLTSVLDSDPTLARAGVNANEIVIPKLDMQGLGDYSRNSGYVAGDTTLTWETVTFNYDRGRMFSIDAMDDEESINIAFGKLSSEFIRTKVVPEVDAFRFAKMAGTSGISKVATGVALATGDAVVSALRTGTNVMDEAEVTAEGRILFITPTNYGLIQDLDTNKSREVLSRFSQIVQVPQSRFYTAIKLNTGGAGELAGGYAKAATGAADINFMIVEPSAVIQFNKHVVPKIITPDMNQNADAWKFGYRNYSLVDVYDNKVSGIYLHHGVAN